MTSEIRVRLHGSWASDEEVRRDFNRYTPAGDFRWRELVLSEDDDYDHLIVFNHPRQELERPDRAILFECETAALRKRFRREHGHWIDAIPVAFEIDASFTMPGWSVHTPFSELSEHPQKTRGLSTVTSGLTWLPLQRQRFDFVVNHLSELTALDHFGRDGASGQRFRGEIADKAEALLPYRYTYAAENSREPNYFTEKIHDAIVCECLAFYDGCPNLDRFLDPDCFVRVDSMRPTEAMTIIDDTMASGAWERRLPALRAQKRRLMHELNPLEIVRKAVLGEPIVWRPELRQSP